MSYTEDQLLQIQRSEKSGWIMLRSDNKHVDPDLDVSKVVPAAGAIESDGLLESTY